DWAGCRAASRPAHGSTRAGGIADDGDDWNALRMLFARGFERTVVRAGERLGEIRKPSRCLRRRGFHRTLDIQAFEGDRGHGRFPGRAPLCRTESELAIRSS